MPSVLCFVLAVCALSIWPVPAAPALRPQAPETPAAVADPGISAWLRTQAGRPAVVNFWASWCEPCRDEMPALAALAAQGFTVLTIAVADRDVDAARFMREAGIELPVLHDREQRLSRAWGARMLPYTVVLDRHHHVVARAQGVVDWNASAVREQLQRLMR